MPKRRPGPDPTTGVAELHYSGFKGQVAYRIVGDATGLRAQSPPLRGQFTADPADAEAAFHAGEARLLLEDGRDYRIIVLAYSAGDDTAYFEIRL
jgi:hypothetical protein